MSLRGVDISAFQGDIDLSALDVDFCVIKATEGKTYVNPYMKSKYEQAKSLGILRGLYHFATGKRTGVEEAMHFIDTVKEYIGDAILVLDWEGDAIYSGVEYAKEFMDTVYNKTGVKPMLYTFRYAIDRYDFSSVVESDYGLWLATLDGTEHHSYREFSIVAMVQLYAKPMSGYPKVIDQNVFYGTKESWLKYQRSRKETSKRYEIGTRVRFSTCYRSSNAPITEHIPAYKMRRTTGTITRIVKGARNPYLLDNGLCWVNEGDIREVL